MPFFVILIIAIVSGIVLDQISKIIVDSLMYVGQSVPIIPDFIHITYVQNKGAAFGMLSNQRWIFMSISTVAIIAMGIYLFKFSKDTKLIKIGIAIVISGGIGNMIDRIIRGFVVDMIDFTIIDFAVFNIADSLVCVGAGLVVLGIILSIVKDGKKKKAKETQSGKDNEDK